MRRSLVHIRPRAAHRPWSGPHPGPSQTPLAHWLAAEQGDPSARPVPATDAVAVEVGADPDAAGAGAAVPAGAVVVEVEGVAEPDALVLGGADGWWFAPAGSMVTGACPLDRAAGRGGAWAGPAAVL